jgi:hypothetical protein
MQYTIQGTDGNSYGPVDFQTLKQWTQEGRVLPDTMITDGLANTQFRASTMPELGLATAPPPPMDYSAPPSAYGHYPRQDMVVEQGTRLWAILFWLALAVVLSMFTRSGGLIISGWNIFDAFGAMKRRDKYGVICLVVAVVGFLGIIGFTMLKVSNAPGTQGLPSNSDQ